jgi:hypothetical protein
MTQHGARADLSTATSELWTAVCELVLIALEDTPSPSDLAVVDDLVDTVSGLQGDVAACRDLLAPAAPVLSVTMLAELQHQLAVAALRYWRGIRAYESAAQLRSAVRRRGGEWGAWLGSVHESAARCEAPLRAVESACHLAWAELSETGSGLPATDPTTTRRKT